MNEILHADDAELAQGALDQVVGGDGGAVASNLSRKNLSGVRTFFSELCYTFRAMYQTFSGHYTNVKVGNVGYRKIWSRTAYSPAAQNKMLANFCPR